MAIQVRRGNEADFDASKMLPGEWAVSLDTKYVRMCFAPGIVLRMATYDSFESDKSQIQEILEECKDIESAVKRIESEVNNKAALTIEYSNSAKDSADKAYNEAERAKKYADNMGDFNELSQRIYDLSIKNVATGENIHIADSKDDNVIELEVYGKSTQGENPSPENPQEVISSVVSEIKSHGKNYLKYPYLETSKTVSGITLTDLGDGRIKAKGTSTARVTFQVHGRGQGEVNDFTLPNGNYIFSGCPNGGSSTTYSINFGITKNDAYVELGSDRGSGVSFTASGDDFSEDSINLGIAIDIKANQTIDLIFEPMIRRVEDLDATWEPYKESVVTLSQPIELRRIEVTVNDDYTYSEDGKYYIADTIEKIDGEYKKVQRISEKVFDGVNNLCSWVGSVTANSVKLWQINLDNKAIGDSAFIRSNAILSNKFKAIAWNASSDSVAYGCRQGSNKAICCYLNESDGVTDVATANAWLQENNVTVYYILSEPITTSLPSEVAELDNLLTFYPITNVSNNANAEMKVKYYADTKNYIDGKIATLEMALVNNI